MQLHFLIQKSDFMWYEHERGVSEPQGNFGMFYNHSAVRSHSKCCAHSFPFPLSQAGQARKTRKGIGRKGAKR